MIRVLHTSTEAYRYACRQGGPHIQIIDSLNRSCDEAGWVTNLVSHTLHQLSTPRRRALSPRQRLHPAGSAAQRSAAGFHALAVRPLATRGGVAAQLQRCGDLVEAAQPDDGVQQAPMTCTCKGNSDGPRDQGLERQWGMARCYCA